MPLDVAQKLLDLTRLRRFDELLVVWRGAAANQREAEIPKRLAAAALAQSGDLDAASTLLRELLTRETIEAATCALAARVLSDVGDLTSSLNVWERALALAPNNFVWWTWFAKVAISAGQAERALRGSEAHALHREQHIDVALAYVTLLANAQRADEALITFERIVSRWPNHPEAGPLFAAFVMREFPLKASNLMRTRQWCPQPAPLSPARVRASLAIPAFFDSEASAAQWRAHLLAQLVELKELARNSTLQGDERASCLSMTPFFAAFHDADITAIQFAWGDFVEELVAPLRATLGFADQSRRPIFRVGIVSNRLTDSSAGRFFNGWVKQLVDAQFEVRLYALGPSDLETDRLSRIATTHRVHTDDVSLWLPLTRQLMADDNDLLLFPEPQGSPLIMLIAGLRCAPIQCAAFGNPVTTGLHSMDYFLVPDAAEVPSPESFYREKVVRIEGIGFIPAAAPLVSGFDRKSFGFGDRERIYLVNQQLPKWNPDFVDAICDVLQQDKRGRLVYFGVGTSVSIRAAQMHLRSAFNARGVDIAERSMFLVGLDRPDFLALNLASDVSLDTFGFGGGSTTMDALSVGLPVITLEGRFLRSRQTSGMLRNKDLSQFIACNQRNFVDVAVAVGQTPLMRANARARFFQTGWTATRAESSRSCSRNLVEFFESLNRQQSA